MDRALEDEVEERVGEVGGQVEVEEVARLELRAVREKHPV